jgi:hypothetical protein
VLSPPSYAGEQTGVRKKTRAAVGSKCYFFSGKEYIRVSRGVTGPGTTLDFPGAAQFGGTSANGINNALRCD